MSSPPPRLEQELVQREAAEAAARREKEVLDSKYYLKEIICH